jgi:hypothetical protein
MLQKRAVHVACVTMLAIGIGGCEAEKSRNPLSPTIAGPIAGVQLTAPKALEPANNSRVHAAQQPLQLLFENSSSNGERPFWHVLEVASDSGFSNRFYTSDKLSPGANGRTAHRLPSLGTGRTYFWRVKADDGANSSGYSDLRSFEVLVPVVINPPVPVSPVGNQTTSSTAVTFVMNNGSVSSSAGAVVYRVEVATDQGFGSLVASGQAPRSGGSTTSLGLNLPPGAQLFWRARGFDNVAVGAWSSVAAFKTPAAPSGGGGGGGGGGGWVPPPPPPGTNRTPNPPPGQRLPLPNMSGVVQQVAREYPAALRNSCQSHGGTWEFMDRVVDRLRQYDTRWGYNWKRGNVGDPSHDVVDYNWGSQPDEGTIQVYIIDIIVGHCGPNPSPGWLDVTDVTFNSGTIGRWTGRGRF